MIATARQALGLLDRKDRRRFFWLLLLSVVLAMLEIAGIGSIVPFIGALASTGDGPAHPYLVRLQHWSGYEQEHSFLVFLGSCVIAAMTLRNVFFAFSNWLVALFTALCRRNLATRLLECYLSRPYAYFLTRNTNELRRNVFEESAQVIEGVLIPFTRIASSSCVALAILTMLFITDPSAAATAFVTLGSAYALIYWYTGSRVDKLGQLGHGYRQQAHRVGSEAFGGIKDLKLLKREALFIDSYRSISERLTRVDMRRNAIGLIPRYAIETLAIAGVVMFILYTSRGGAALGQMLPVLALYLLAGYRLLPALQSIYTNLGYLRFNRVVLQTLHDDLADPAQPVESRSTGETLGFEHAIDICDVSFAYPQAQAEALQGVSLRIDKNTSVAFVGTTGAGKTTLVDMLMGLLRPTSGSILIDGVSLTADNVGAWQRNIGYVPQHIWLSDDSITRNIAFGVPDEDIDHEAVRAAATAASLHEFILTELGQGYDTVIGERGIRLSGGQRQRVGIARALYHRPSVLVLDEATSALDGATEKAIIEAVDTLSRKITVVLIAHRLNTVIDCDRIFVLERGCVVDDGDYASLLRDSSAFQRLAR
ncbi:MAG: hypothetical protein B7Y51_02720 [Burkholderiales bacterium 28-67-8]|nr:MAG: hypothetical protein B7Y51_02720 [Burkholderiales bacterium 28-67-8]